MRIIAGKHRGKVLKAFDADNIRPTHDRAKEAIFNIFKDDIPSSSFLDLFCGSGNVGIEALSRGAVVTMCDISQKSVDLTKKNLALIKETCTVMKADAIDYLKSVKEKFDFIFIDPPYASEVGLDCLRLVGERCLLKKGGVAIYERDREEKHEIDGLIYLSSRRYGKTVFNIYKNESF